MVLTSVPSSPFRPCKGREAKPLLRQLARLAVAGLLALAASIAQATAGGMVRDAETEGLIRDYIEPIFKVAGVQSPDLEITLIDDPSFNAFVADNRHLFVNTGTIITTESPNELTGILAHETAHLAHGDLARLKQTIANAKSAALIASLLGLGAAVAGATTGDSSIAQAGSGLALGTAQVTQRSILAFQRTQETDADRSAMDFLDKTGQSGAGMVKAMKRLADENLLFARDANPYLLTHPLPQERLDALQTLAQKSKFLGATDSPDFIHRHAMVRAKLIGFTWPPDRVNRRFPPTDTSLPARYARAVMAYRSGSVPQAVQLINGLIASEPANPYFYELKGQALLEGGKAKDSLQPLRKAVSLAPKAGLIRVLLGQALVSTNDPTLTDEAIRTLTMGLQADPDIPIGYEMMARAYAVKNDIPMAELATAEGHFMNGNVKDAKLHAARAQARLQPHSPAWLRADDIVSYKPPKLK
jgi:predicted Zn-dependent protease